MQPARETAGADISFPLIKETRPLPLRDAEVRRTHYTDHERKSNHMKPTYTNSDPGFMLRQYAHVLEKSKKEASEALMQNLFANGILSKNGSRK